MQKFAGSPAFTSVALKTGEGEEEKLTFPALSPPI
jgi:hypothetical protein